jgi:hypothetical protein
VSCRRGDRWVGPGWLHGGRPADYAILPSDGGWPIDVRCFHLPPNPQISGFSYLLGVSTLWVPAVAGIVKSILISRFVCRMGGWNVDQ